MVTLDTIQGKFIIRKYRDSDREQIISLFKEVFNQDKPPTLWEWEFLDNPYGTEIIVCEHETEGIIAQCAGLPAPLALNNKIYKCAQLVDCMCKREYRAFAVKKKGLFGLTVEHYFDTFTGEDKNIYLYGFPGERHYRLGRLILQYKKTRPALEGTIYQTKQKNTHMLKLKEIKSNIQKYTKKIRELAEQDANIHKICIFKSPEYFLWRYVKSYKKYKIFCLTTLWGKIKSICVITEDRDNIKLIDIIGIIHLKDIISHIFYEFKKPIILGFPENSIIHKILNEINADIHPITIPIIPVGRSFWEGLNPVFANNNFYYTMGDCDLF